MNATTQKMELSLNELLDEREWMGRLSRALLGKHAADADDVAQDSWLDALRGRSDARSSRPWLGAIVRRRAAARGRSDSRRTRRERAAARPEESSADAPSEVVERFETQRIVAAAVSELPEPYRTTILQHYYEGVRLVDIARESGSPSATIRWRLRKGHELLRDALEKRYGKAEWRAALLPLCGAGTRLVGKTSTQLFALLLLLGAGAIAIGVSLPFLSTDTPDASAMVVPETEEGDGIAAKIEDDETKARERVASEETPSSQEKAEQAQVRPGKTEHATVRARFLDAAGKAISGVRLGLSAAELGGSRIRHPMIRALPSAKSSGDGRVVLPLRAGERLLALVDADQRPGPGEAWTLFVQASVDGYLQRELRFAVPSGGSADLGDVTLERAGSVRGRVLDENGKPAANVEVRASVPPFPRYYDMIRRQGDAPRGVAQTRSARFLGRGNYSFKQLPRGPVMLWIARQGYEATHALVHVGDKECVAPDLKLTALQVETREASKKIELVVRVLLPDSSPVRRALVLCETKSKHGPEIRSAVTFREGRGAFQLPAKDAAKQRYTLHAVAKGYAPTSLEDVAVDGREVELRLKKLETFRVRIRSARRESTVTGASATLKSSLGALLAKAKADPGNAAEEARDEGGTVLELARPSTGAELFVRAPGHAEKSVELRDPSSLASVLDVVLDPIPTIRGRVVHRGQTVAGARVMLLAARKAGLIVNGFAARYSRKASVVTDATGAFSLDADSDLRVASLRVQKAGFAPSMLDEVKVGPQGRDGLVIEVGRGVEVFGRVLDNGARPVPFAVVGLNDFSGSARTVTCDSTGKYRFENVADGNYELRTSERRIDEGSEAFSVLSTSSPVANTGNISIRGRDKEHDIRLGSCRLEGRLRIDGCSAQGWQVDLQAPGRLRSYAQVKLTPNGSYKLATELPGRYLLEFSSPGGPLGVVRIQAEIELEARTNTREDFVTLRPFSAPATNRQGSGWLVQEGPEKGWKIRASCEVLEGVLKAALAPVGPVQYTVGFSRRRDGPTYIVPKTSVPARK